jgi:hypothetical protein
MARVSQVLDESDIVSRIHIVQAYLNEVKANRRLRERESISLATEDVKGAIERLQKEVDAVHAELEAHSQRYFASWRTPDVEAGLSSIHVWSKRLDERMKTLRDITTLASATEPRKED